MIYNWVKIEHLLPDYGKEVLCLMAPCFSRKYMLLTMVKDSSPIYAYQWEDGDGNSYDPDDVVFWQELVPPEMYVATNDCKQGNTIDSSYAYSKEMQDAILKSIKPALRFRKFSEV